MTVLLATCASLPDGEPGAAVLDAALGDRGVDFRWARWDDDSVDWVGADLVAIRSTWDYTTRSQDFLTWSRTPTRLLNGPDVVAWNHDKAYLVDLATSGVPAVPTMLAVDRSEFAAALEAYGEMVVKPRVGAGGAGVIVVDSLDDSRLGTSVQSHPTYAALGGPWLCQPLVESVHTDGETSVYVLDGEVVSQFLKRTAGDDVRVNEEFGGVVHEVPVEGDAADLAREAMTWAGRRFGRALDYGRVDMMRLGGRWVVSELELIEPGLYLDVSATNAAPFADLVARRLSG